MSPRPARVASATFALATTALLAVVMLHAYALSEAVQEVPVQRTYYEMSDEGISAGWGGPVDYVVSTYTMPVAPGDVVTIPPFNGNGGEGVSLFVVEGGQGEAIVRNQPPEHVYLQLTPAHGAKLVRPEPPAGTPRAIGGKGYDLDVVWLGRDHGILAVQQWSRENVEVSVVNPSAYASEPWWKAAQWTLAVVAAGSGGAWLLLARREHAPAEEASGAEALARLADSAGDYLLRLRSVLRMAGFLLVLGIAPMLGFVTSLTRGRDLFLWFDLGLTSLGDWLMVAYAGVLLLWLRHYLILRREIRRWRQATQARPLGL